MSDEPQEQEQPPILYAILCQISANCDAFSRSFNNYRPVDPYIDRLEKLIEDYRKEQPKPLGVRVSDGIGTKDKTGG